VMVDHDNLNPLDFANYLGVEFMTPSVTSAALTEMLAKGIGSGGGGLTEGLGTAAVRLNNPHIRYFNSGRYGYSTVTFTRTSCEWIAYEVDKAGADPSATTRHALARFRKATNWPFLTQQSISGV
jgi:alkaline phosphatase D